MKSSTLKDFIRLFETSIRVRDIAEPLASFDSERMAEEVRKFMQGRNYDIVGVRVNGVVAGVVELSSLQEGRLNGSMISPENDCILEEHSPMVDLFERLKGRSWVLVTVAGQMWGIVTIADLDKAAVRMFVFGLISLLEMAMLRIIRKFYPGDSWKVHGGLSQKRLAAAEQLFELRTRHNAEIDLSDCLQLCDKRDILQRNASLLQQLGFTKKAWRRTFSGLEALRNELAHSQSIVSSQWPGLAEKIESASALLHKMERMEGEPVCLEQER
jgi:hypothetical protein